MCVLAKVRWDPLEESQGRNSQSDGPQFKGWNFMEKEGGEMIDIQGV